MGHRTIQSYLDNQKSAAVMPNLPEDFACSHNDGSEVINYIPLNIVFIVCAFHFCI